MTFPIIAYGHPILRKKAKPITEDYPDLKVLIANMFDTMYKSSGIGLAAPQIGLSIRIFIIDISPLSESPKFSKEERPAMKDFKKVFINPQILEESGEQMKYNEGCLSIPNVHEDVYRSSDILISYQDEVFDTHVIPLKGMAARVVQHEYDHVEGILFTDKITPLKRKLVRSKLLKIAKGKVSTDYDMTFFKS